MGRGNFCGWTGRNLSHGGQSGDFKGRNGGPGGGFGAGLDIHDGTDLMAEAQCLIRGDWCPPLLGQSGKQIPVGSEVRATTDKNDGYLRTGSSDFWAPMVQRGEQGGWVGDLVAEQVHVRLPERQIPGRTGSVRSWKEQKGEL